MYIVAKTTFLNPKSSANKLIPQNKEKKTYKLRELVFLREQEP